MGPERALEQRASIATPGDYNSISALADEIFNFPRSFPRLPIVMERMVKDRLVQAEILYGQKKSLGIHEEAIVRTINDLSDKLGAPEHSKTTMSQVRVLRMWLALSEPKFMGAGMADREVGVGESINQTMGPLQAAHLMATLIDQKFVNPDFQVTPQEWEQTSIHNVRQNVQRAQARVAGMQLNPGAPVSNLKVRVYSSSKRRDMEESVARNISFLTVTERFDLIEQAFATLGID